MDIVDNEYRSLGHILADNGGLRVDNYSLFDDRLTPWIIDFEPLLQRAGTLKTTAQIFYWKMAESKIFAGDKPVFLLGSPITGIILASAIAHEIYSTTSGPDKKGLDLRIGFFAKDQDLVYLNHPDPEKRVENKLKKEFPSAKKSNVITVRQPSLRGEDLVRFGATEAAKLVSFQSEADSVVAVGYGGMPWAVSIALGMAELGKPPYVAYERFTKRAYTPSGSSFVGGVKPGGNYVLVRIADNAEPGFQGQLQDGDNVLIIDDIAAKERELMGEVRKVLHQNPRARVAGVMAGVDRREKEGDRKLGESLDAAKIDLYSVTTAEELIVDWHNIPDTERKLTDQQFEQLMEYQRRYAY